MARNEYTSIDPTAQDAQDVALSGATVAAVGDNGAQVALFIHQHTFTASDADAEGLITVTGLPELLDIDACHVETLVEVAGDSVAYFSIGTAGLVEKYLAKDELGTEVASGTYHPQKAGAAPLANDSGAELVIRFADSLDAAVQPTSGSVRVTIYGRKFTAPS